MFTNNDREFLNNPDYSMPLEKFTDSSYYIANNGRNGSVSQAYPFSNEKLHNIFKHIKSSGCKSLTVGSSGDQLLYLLYNGCKNITLIDANLYSKYWVEYKIAAIKNLTFSNFKEYFLDCFINRYKTPFDYEIYSKIFHDLSEDSKMFWGQIFLENYTPQNIFDILLERCDSNLNRIYSIFYQDNNAYNKLQRLLNNNDYQIEFINENFSDFCSTIKSKFDIILLSNIKRYVDEKTFKDTVDYLYQNNLNKGGIIQLHYEYYNALGKKSQHITKLFPNKTINGYNFKNRHYTYLMKKPTFSLNENNEKIL